MEHVTVSILFYQCSC